MPSFYYPQLSKDSTELILENEEFHHLSRVKRIGADAMIKITGGNGLVAECKVLELGKRRASLEPVKILEHLMPEPDFAIAFALLKNHHDEMVVEKCTELGVSEFFPIITEHTVRDEGRNTVARFEKIALAAIKQCDNPWLPKLHSVLPLAEALAEMVEQGFQPLLCSEKEQLTWLSNIRITGRPCFIIGPEGGFSEAEHVLMQDIASICISRLIMRAETAAICVASQFQLLRESRQGSQA
jgi:16S rRNA (uracil1498-N3)-methyltransferase